MKIVNLMYSLILLSVILPFRYVLADAEGSRSANALKMVEEIRKDYGVVNVFYDPKADIQWNIGVLDNGRDLYALANYYCAMIQYETFA